MRLWPRSTGDRIRTAFAFLTEPPSRYRLLVESDGGMAGAVTYRSDELWVAVEWDRSDPWLEVSPTRSEIDKFDWEVADHVLRGATAFAGPGVPRRTASIDDLAAWLREHLAEIEARFRPPARAATVAQLARLEAERRRIVQRWWDDLWRRPTPAG